MGDLQIMNLFDFSKGMVQRRTNLLDYPVNALWDGENVNVSDKFLQTRPGMVVCSTEILADGVVEYLTQSRFPVINKTYLLAQLRSAAACKLYVSDTTLPSTSISFTEVYDLGLTAGMVSVATLNNRAIITEGVANPPLVFLGGLATDGSDFATPLTVFGTLDGTYFFDMTGALTDADPDTEYTLNAMPAAGGIYIRFDVRTLSGLYVEVETANTTTCDLLIYKWDGTTWLAITHTDNTKTTGCTLAKSGTITWTAVNTEYREIAEVAGYWLKIVFSITAGGSIIETANITAESDITQQNMRGTIRSWSQDSGATGRFRDVSGNAVVVNSSSGFWEGSEVLLADATYVLISDIAGDGTTSGDITLAESKATQNVTGIYNGKISGVNYTTGVVDAAAVVVADGATNTGTSYCTTIMTANNAPSPVVISGSVHDGYLFPAFSQGTYNSAYSPCFTTGSYITYDFGSGNSKVINKYDLFVYFAAPGSYNILKSWTIHGSNNGSAWDLLHTITNNANGTLNNWLSTSLGSYFTFSNSTAYRYYKLTCTDSWGTHSYLKEIKYVEAAYTITTYPAITTSNSNIRVSLPTGATVVSVAATQATANASQIYHAVSFDLQITYKVFVSSAWRSIARNNTGTWQYNDSANATPNWVNSTVNSCQDALSQAFGVALNKMTTTTLAALTDANWVSTGGVAAGGTIDFAVGLYAAGTFYPTFDKYTVNATIAAGAVTTDISKITFKAPTQLLRNISESGVYDTAMAFVTWISATNKINDYSVEVADGGLTTYAVAGGLVTADYIYVAGVTEFNGLKLTLVNGANQTNSVTLSAAYWNGSAWTAVTITDGTAVSGKTLNQSGTITWTTPTDWKDLTPIVGAMVQGYWIRLKPSGTLSATVNIAEARLSAQPPPLVKHKFTSTLDNRLVLGNRPEAKDQVDLSRQFEEYGFTGDTTFSARAGTQEGIVAVTKTYNQVWLAKGDDWFALSTNTDGTIGTSRADATSQIPINNTSCVIAPLDQLGKTTISPIADAKNRTGIYFINYSGAWCFTGTEIYKISESVNWWLLVSENPRIDLDYLQGCVGAYWPERGWIMWAVPMIVGAATSQATNNYLIVYDLGLGAWMPIFSVSASALSQAIEYKSSHPEKMGALALYAGGYDGIVRRIFEVTSSDDAGTAIACDAETGWLPFNDPAIEKILRVMKIFGTLTTGNLTLEVRCDGEGTTQTGNTFTITDLSLSPTKAFVIEFNNRNVHGNIFKFLLSWSGPGSIYGMQVEYGNMRDWPTTA